MREMFFADEINWLQQIKSLIEQQLIGLCTDIVFVN